LYQSLTAYLRLSNSLTSDRALLKSDDSEYEQPRKDLCPLSVNETDVAERHAIQQPHANGEKQQWLNIGETVTNREP
jgi:hypothetical protein